MRVVSLVPSWTETFLDAGIPVVGRTRFCIHPADRVSSIPIVGGTKTWNWPRIEALSPDILILDREENAAFMAGQSTFPWHATDIRSVADMPGALTDLARILAAQRLIALAERWEKIITRAPLVRAVSDDIPGLLAWGSQPAAPLETVLYLVWKDPWIAVGRNTFIGSVLALLGIDVPTFPSRYQRVELSDFDPARTLLLLSSEPYPFWRDRDHLAGLPFPHAFVDGESFGWFGNRTLAFLESRFTPPCRAPGEAG